MKISITPTPLKNRKAEVKFFNTMTKTLVILVVIFSAQFRLYAQPCSDFEIKFLQTNVMACDDQAVFYLEKEGVSPSTDILDVDVHTWAGFTFTTPTNYDPGMGTLTFYGVAISSYKKFGTFTATVIYNGGNCEISGKVIECCNEGLTSALIVVDEDITDQTTATTLTGDVIFMGDVTFAANSYIFNTTRVYLGPDAQLLPQVNADFTFRTANLQPFCDCRWDRILLADGSNTLDMDGTTLLGALRGINATTAVATSLTSSNFYNNMFSLVIENSTGTGPYNGSYFKVDDCEFNFQTLTGYCHNTSLSSVDLAPLQALAPGIAAQVLVWDNSNNIHIGHENYAQNTFNMGTPPFDPVLICINSSEAFVRNNQFIGGHNNVLAGSKAHIGGTVAQMNIHTANGIEVDISAAIINNNSFSGGGVLFTNPTNAAVPGGSANGCEMAYNDFTGSSITVDGNNGSVRFRVFDNFIENTPVSLKEMSGSGSNILIFHSNHLEKNSVNSIVSIIDCNEMVFANNFIEHTSFYVPNTGGANYIGVHWEDTENAIASNNEFQNCSYGFRIKEDNSGTQYTCNDFLNCYHAFYLDSDPTISNQGSSTVATDNCYNYAYAGSTFPYAEQIAGTYSSSSNWYIRSSISCTLPQPFASCYCTLIETSNIPSLSIQTGSANNCTIPSSSKTAPTDLTVSKHNAFQYYPNPVATEITLIFEVPTSFIIYNLQGQQIYAQQDQENALVDVRQWPDGTYIIRTPTQSGKFVVRK